MRNVCGFIYFFAHLRATERIVFIQTAITGSKAHDKMNSQTSSFTGSFETTFEPRRKKTGLRGFRPGPTQIGLYSHRSRLDT